MGTYSLNDVQVTVIGPGLAVSLGGGGGGFADEAIVVTMVEDKNTMTVGGDGSGMHNLHAGNSGTLTIRLLKTSPYNAVLSAAYNFQKASGATWGQNTLTIVDPVRGDFVSATQVAFKKQPDLTYAKEGGMNEWTFDAIQINEILGTGVPDVNV